MCANYSCCSSRLHLRDAVFDSTSGVGWTPRHHGSTHRVLIKKNHVVTCMRGMPNYTHARSRIQQRQAQGVYDTTSELNMYSIMSH